MPAGRKPQGIEQVELLPGSAAAKRRLEVFLANLSGELSVAEACAALGLHESRFFELRKRWLEESVELLEPGQPGRPAGPSSVLLTSTNLPGDPENGSAVENRPRRIASDARGGVGSTPDTSENGRLATSEQQRIAELQELLAAAQWELRTSRLREELAALGLSRPKVGQPAPKKKGPK